jgi:hypothetical protein
MRSFRLLLLILLSSSALTACGSGTGAGGGGSALTGGAGSNSLNDPVQHGQSGAGERNEIPPNAISVTIPVPPVGSRSEVMFDGNMSFNGTATLLIEISNPQNMGTAGLALQSVTFTSASGLFFTESFAVANGDTLVSTNDVPLKTLAVSLLDGSSSGINALTYPTRGRDEPLMVTQYLQRIDFVRLGGGQFTGRIVLKNDRSFQVGSLKANVFLVGQNVQNASNDISDSIEIFRDIYRSIGVTVDVEISSLPNASGNLTAPPAGSAFYETGAQALPDREDAVHIYIGSTISTPFLEGFGSILGASGGLPGSFFPSRRSAVAISLDAHTGTDGNLLPFRKRLLAETIAHEVGHYLGLFHPVERDLSRENFFHDQDPLGDTPTCVTLNECISIGLTSNLMFPLAIDAHTPQQRLTSEQAVVINIQPLVQ